MAKKLYAVLGLGIFGSTVAKVLSEYDCDVIAIDKDIVNVDRVSKFCDRAIQADFTDIEQLKECGMENVDIAVVATGDLLDQSALGVMNLKSLGVEYIVAKARNKVFKEILEKVGANKIVRPEKEMGEKVAKTLLSKNLVDFISIDDKYSIVEIKANESWVGKSLKELNMRSKYGINIIGLRKTQDGPLTLSPDADYRIEDTDIFLVIAEKDKLDENEYLGKL